MSALLDVGEITILGRHPAASNAVFLVDVIGEDSRTRAIYKPVAGERELWDFPDGALARREVAAHVLCSSLGFDFVPTTVWRESAPHGPGSLQEWIEDASLDDVAVVEEAQAGWLHVLDGELQDGTAVAVVHRDAPDLRTLALLDAIMNNADRKAGHLLRDTTGALRAVDHGVTFHHDPKLRTVLWGFAEQELSDHHVQTLERVPHVLPLMSDWLDTRELDALLARASALLTERSFPTPSPDWPAIPWPIW